MDADDEARVSVHERRLIRRDTPAGALDRGGKATGFDRRHLGGVSQVNIAPRLRTTR